jgi:uncharacterized protein (TIGR02284 family)
MDERSKAVRPQAGQQPGREAETRAGPPQPSPVGTTLEADYWKTNYQHRPYVEPGVSFEEYAPAYRYGWEMYTVHLVKGRPFDELEPELARNWDTNRRGSRLGWDKARHAVRDAWDRMAGNRATPTPGATSPATTAPEKSSEIISHLTRLVHLCTDGVKGFRAAAEKIEPSYAPLFRQFAAEREAIATELRSMILQRGGDPDKAGDAAGALHRGWTNLKSALGGGTKAILSECERGEDAAVKAYQGALNLQSLPPDVETALNRQYAKVKNAHDQVRAMRDAAQ